MLYKIRVDGAPGKYIDINVGVGLGPNGLTEPELDEELEIVMKLATSIEGWAQATAVTVTHEETVTVQDYPSP